MSLHNESFCSNPFLVSSWTFPHNLLPSSLYGLHELTRMYYVIPVTVNMIWVSWTFSKGKRVASCGKNDTESALAFSFSRTFMIRGTGLLGTVFPRLMSIFTGPWLGLATNVNDLNTMLTQLALHLVE